MKEYVILVDEDDREIGVEEKQAAHEKALCHRAFSVVVMRDDEVLLQQRQKGKYHCGGLWTNTCCSHPRPGESILGAGKRRLKEEMGFCVELKEVGSFHYIAKFDNGLTENEVDHVLVGEYHDEPIVINSAEVSDYRWVKLGALKADLEKCPERYTPWLGFVLDCV